MYSWNFTPSFGILWEWVNKWICKLDSWPCVFNKRWTGGNSKFLYLNFFCRINSYLVKSCLFIVFPQTSWMATTTYSESYCQYAPISIVFVFAFVFVFVFLPVFVFVFAALNLPQQFSAPGSISSHLSVSRQSQRLFTQHIKLWEMLKAPSYFSIYVFMLTTTRFLFNKSFSFYISVKHRFITQGQPLPQLSCYKCFSPGCKKNSAV